MVHQTDLNMMTTQSAQQIRSVYGVAAVRQKIGLVYHTTATVTRGQVASSARLVSKYIMYMSYLQANVDGAACIHSSSSTHSVIVRTLVLVLTLDFNN